MAERESSRECAYCGPMPRRRHAEWCPCAAHNRDAIRRAYAKSDESGRIVADAIYRQAQEEMARG
jgi:hypothetical protein